MNQFYSCLTLDLYFEILINKSFKKINDIFRWRNQKTTLYCMSDAFVNFTKIPYFETFFLCKYPVHLRERNGCRLIWTHIQYPLLIITFLFTSWNMFVKKALLLLNVITLVLFSDIFLVLLLMLYNTGAVSYCDSQQFRLSH